ncbi:MAG: hypothetical protein MRECE_23c005 [Mycoplasmataceae bacterium CE_OT135]|nr:MAG: hypothetical protein MRECE_23c005 [Mycoplasmataceae bacterium CE_OT135]
MNEKIKCSKDNPCSDCRKIAQDKLAKIGEWEVNRRKALENLDLEKEVECSFCPNRTSDGNRTQHSSAGHSQGYSYEDCPECGKEKSLSYIHKSNDYGDKTKSLQNKRCSCEIAEEGSPNQIKSNQIKSNQIKSNQIKSNVEWYK